MGKDEFVNDELGYGAEKNMRNTELKVRRGVTVRKKR